VRLDLKVVPGASRDRVVGWIGGRLKIQVSAPAERGRANEAVLALLAAVLELPRRGVRLVAGAASPLKSVEVDADESRVRARVPRG
jgi:uncharacterized protein (TIGR00251 family)